MIFESMSIADLKRQSSRYRSMADKIDAAVASLESLISQDFQEAPVPQSSPAPAVNVATPRKGKQPGAVSGKWKSVLWDMAEMQHASQGISTAEIISIVHHKLRQTKRPAELSRQFRPYVEAGYLVQPFQDRYLVTEAGKSKVGFIPASESMFEGYQIPNQTSQEEGPEE